MTTTIINIILYLENLKPFSLFKSVIYKGGYAVDEFENEKDFLNYSVKTYSDTIYRVALNITKNSDDAFDICQEVYLRLLKNKHKIKNKDHLKAWLLRTTVNCGKSFKTQAYKKYTIALDNCKESSVDFTYDELSVIESVMALPKKYSVTIYLYYYEDMQIKEIGKILHISESGVKSRLKRGKDKLKNILKENGYD